MKPNDESAFDLTPLPSTSEEKAAHTAIDIAVTNSVLVQHYREAREKLLLGNQELEAMVDMANIQLGSLTKENQEYRDEISLLRGHATDLNIEIERLTKEKDAYAAESYRHVVVITQLRIEVAERIEQLEEEAQAALQMYLDRFGENK